MMMSKPAPVNPGETAKPAAKQTPQEAVADLERRLAQLTPTVPVAAASTTTDTVAAPPAFANPPAASIGSSSQPPSTAAAPIKGGKNALLVSVA